MSEKRFSVRKHKYLIGIVLLLIAALQTATADEGEEWLYHFQPGDNLWDLTERFLIDQQYWQRLVRLNKVRHPRQMPPGTQVRIPLNWLKVQPTVAQVLRLRGRVRHLSKDGTEQPLTTESALRSGDRLIVAEQSSVVLQFSDGSQQLLGADTEAELIRVRRFSTTGIADTVVKITRGKAEQRVPVKGTRFEIHTPSANTSVRGTDFRVGIARERQATSRIEVLDGSVDVQGEGGGVLLAAGLGTVVTEGSAPRQPVRLLPAPQIAPTHPVIRSLPLRLRWEEVPGAGSYRVLVTEPKDDGDLLLDNEVKTPRFDASALPDGRYHVKVRAIDSLGLEGREGVTEIELDARPLPSASINPTADVTVRTSSVTFEWSVPPQVTGYRFQLADSPGFGSPWTDEKALNNTRLEMDGLPTGTWYWRVASLAEDEQGPWGPVQKFVLKPAPKAPSVVVAADDATLVLRWEEGEPEQRYRIQISEDAAFAEIVEEALLNEPQWSAPRPAVPIHFRVRVVENDGYEGAWSPPQTVYPPPEPWYLFGIPALLIILLAL